LEEKSVDQDPTVDGYTNCLPVLHKKGTTMAVAMVGAPQGKEPLTALDKVRINLAYVSMVFERESRKGIDTLYPMELRDFDLG
jgi:hypothetical protein